MQHSNLDQVCRRACLAASRVVLRTVGCDNSQTLVSPISLVDYAYGNAGLVYDHEDREAFDIQSTLDIPLLTRAASIMCFCAGGKRTVEDIILFASKKSPLAILRMKPWFEPDCDPAVSGSLDPEPESFALGKARYKAPRKDITLPDATEKTFEMVLFSHDGRTLYKLCADVFSRMLNSASDITSELTQALDMCLPWDKIIHEHASISMAAGKNQSNIMFQSNVVAHRTNRPWFWYCLMRVFRSTIEDEIGSVKFQKKVLIRLFEVYEDLQGVTSKCVCTLRGNWLGNMSLTNRPGPENETTRAAMHVLAEAFKNIPKDVYMFPTENEARAWALLTRAIRTEVFGTIESDGVDSMCQFVAMGCMHSVVCGTYLHEPGAAMKRYLPTDPQSAGSSHSG